MADIARPALQITGQIIGSQFGPLGAAIGGAIGGQIGAALFPQNVGEGPKINELRLQGSTYGVPIPLVYGIENRFAGNIIWASELRTTSREVEVSKGNEVTEYTQYVDVAVALCEGPMTNISTIWANGDILWTADWFAADVTAASEDYDAADANATALEAAAVACGAITDPNCAFKYAAAEAARDQADAALVKKGAAITAKADYEAGGTAWSFTSALAKGTTFRFYPGTFSQPVDPTIEANKGAGNASAYYGICYMVIQNLNVTEFNGLPNMEYEVAAQATTLRQILADIHAKSGLNNYDYSVGTGLDDTVKGYVVTRQMNSLAAIVQLERTFAFDTVEQWGQLRHVKRGRMSAATLEEGDLDAKPGGGGAGQPITPKRTHDETLPKVATISYRDAARDYQPNSQRAQRSLGSSQNIINLEVGITLDNSHARQIADRLLWEPWTGRMTVTIKGHPKLEFLLPADVIGLPIAGAIMPFRIERLGRGADGMIEIEARMDDPFIYQGSTSFEAAAINPAPSLQGADTFAIVFNAPILSTSDSATAFNYALDSAGDNWTAGALYRATDGVNYSQVTSATSKNITGTVSVATPGVDNPEIWDRSTVIEVVLTYDEHTLSSKTEDQVLSGQNAIWLGAPDGSEGEVIQFATATLISASPRTYQLSNLLRGRRATEHTVDTHITDEIMVLIETGFYRTVDFSQADWNVERQYKGVTNFQSVDDVIGEQVFTNLLEKARPRSPVQIYGERDGGNDLDIYWQRRIRGFRSALGTGASPLDEVSESYEIDIIDGSNGVVRTLTASSETVSYTSAQQTTDGITPGDPVTGKIYQISATVGRGHEGSFTV